VLAAQIARLLLQALALLTRIEDFGGLLDTGPTLLKEFLQFPDCPARP
jgi:hypothetical protein